MKKIIFYFYFISLLVISCKKSPTEDETTKQLIRSFELPNNAPITGNAYIKGKFNGKSFYINEGDADFPEFRTELWQVQDDATTPATNANFLKIGIGNNDKASNSKIPLIQFNTFPVKGNQKKADLLASYIVEKTFATDREVKKDTLGWEVEMTYPRSNNNLTSIYAEPTLTSLFAGKTQSVGRYFKITKVEKGIFSNNRTLKVTFLFDVDIFYKHRFEVFDRIENGEMVMYI
jgi:hypothetical protein